MSSSIEFVEFVCDQISDLGQVRYRAMFGEYMIYLNEKPVLMVCDDTVYVKENEIIVSLMEEAEKGYPYPGSKEHYILDIDDQAFAQSVIKTLEPVLSVPKKRIPKKKN